RLTANTNVALGSFGGTVNLTNSSVDHNTGPGIWNDSEFQDATMTINNSTVAYNSVLGPVDAFPFNGGAGIFNFSEGGNTASLVATHLALIGNTAPNTQAGGIENLDAFGGAAALVTLSQSLVEGNQSVLGGGIYNDAAFGPGGPATISLQAGTVVAHNQA